MFTGLIEEIGSVSSILQKGNGREITINCSKVLLDVSIDDSICVNGVCQTVVQHAPDTFTVQAIEETLKKTTFAKLKVGDKVNLERSLTPHTRMGGHFVQGHVDCTGTVISVTQLSLSWEYWISFPMESKPLVVKQGSICVNGISLTVADCNQNAFKISIIPHTTNNTTIPLLQVGSQVNLEFDILGKYILHMLNTRTNPKSEISESWLKEQGY